jgi:endo-1,3-1,4-beta-glycanase ExoK
MNQRNCLAMACAMAATAWGPLAHATRSAELYTSNSYQYGRFEASILFARGSGVVGAFFLWKDGSEVAGTFWNELDFEKVGANCGLHTNAYYGNPAQVHTLDPSVAADLCGEYHTYTYEWTPDYIAWLVDGTEVRRATGDAATAYAANATAGMQVRFNIWPGDASFGGVFDPSILPVYEYVDWVQYSSYSNGAFQLAWREDFTASSLPTGWALGDWNSPKGLSTHSPKNVSFVNGVAILALTDDAGTGAGGATSGAGGAAPADADASQSGGGATSGGASAAGGAGDDSGCACRTSAAGTRHAWGLGLLPGAVAFAWARRRRKARTDRRCA